MAGGNQYNRPGTRYYVNAAAAALNHGDPAIADGVVGVAQKQKQPSATAALSAATVIAIGEPYVIICKGVVRVPFVATCVKGTPLYITAAGVLTVTAPGTRSSGVWSRSRASVAPDRLHARRPRHEGLLLMGRYGIWGKQIPLFEAWEDWAERGQARIEDLQEAAADGDADAALALEEADTRFDFPNFLFGPVSTSLWGGYSQVAPQYRRYSRIENMPDLRERRLRGLNQVRGMAYVGENGEYVEGRRTERPSAALTVDKYGFVYKITMEAILNDETGELLNRIPGEMGRDASIFVANTLVALIESNPLAPDGSALFNATRAESDDAGVVRGLARRRHHLHGHARGRLGLPDHRPRGDSDRAEHATPDDRGPHPQLDDHGCQRQRTPGRPEWGSNVFDKGTINPLNGILPADGVVKEVFFTDSNDWYLFADPGDVPGFAIGFLNGNEQPFVGLKEPQVRSAMGPGVDPYTFEFDSIDFKCRHFFGAAPVDPRAAYKGIVP
jgi:hypothetical protein